jgi:hypothetical protein
MVRSTQGYERASLHKRPQVVVSITENRRDFFRNMMTHLDFFWALYFSSPNRPPCFYIEKNRSVFFFLLFFRSVDHRQVMCVFRCACCRELTLLKKDTLDFSFFLWTFFFWAAYHLSGDSLSTTHTHDFFFFDFFLEDFFFIAILT